MSFWTVKEHACKVSLFLHVQFVFYELINIFLILILEKIFLGEIHI
jgi:hypothetical protein